MGLFLCDLCNAHLTLDPHECDKEKILRNIQQLEERARIAERNLDDVQNAVFKLLEPLGSLDGEEVTVKTEWLQWLWDAARCKWHKADTAKSFLCHWMATHRILCEAFDLFRSKKHGHVETKLNKLKHLREACDKAKEVLGYQDSNLDLTPEDLV